MLLLTFFGSCIMRQVSPPEPRQEVSVFNEVWAPFLAPDRTFRVHTPCEPLVTPTDYPSGTKGTRYRCALGTTSIRVETFDYGEGFGGASTETWFDGLPANWVKNSGGTAENVSRTSRNGKPAIRFRIVSDEGETYEVEGVFFGSRLFEFVAISPTTASDSERIRGLALLTDSFVPLDPDDPASATLPPTPTGSTLK